MPRTKTNCNSLERNRVKSNGVNLQQRTKTRTKKKKETWQ